MAAISIIIPNLHSPLIDQVVGALDRQTRREAIREVIVVGQDRYGRVPPDVQFVATPRPLSAAAARNLGAAHARGDYLLFLDSDCIAAPDLIERLLERHEQGYAIVGGSIALEPDDYWVLCDNLLVFAPFLTTAPAGERLYLPSLNFSIARELFSSLGGFDPCFPGASGEDIDLSLRLRQKNLVLFFEPRAIVCHRPQRASSWAVRAHLRRFGQTQVTLWRQYPGLFHARRMMVLPRLAALIIAFAPCLALRDAIRLYATSSIPWRFARLLPGMVWAKTAWYWGVCEALLTETRA